MGLGHLTYPFEARQDCFDDVTPELQPLLASLLSREPHKRPTISQVSAGEDLNQAAASGFKAWDIKLPISMVDWTSSRSCM